MRVALDSNVYSLLLRGHPLVADIVRPLACMVQQWHAISRALAEPPRRRRSQPSEYFDFDAAGRQELQSRDTV